MSGIGLCGPQNVIEVDDLVRICRSSQGFFHEQKKETLAVDHISFSVKKGELSGILGPNGAAAVDGMSLLGISGTLGSELLAGLVAIIPGYLMFRMFENLSRKNGTLDRY